MQNDPWRMFPSFDESLWLEQAKGVQVNEMNASGLHLPLRGEKRLSWPILPAKCLGQTESFNAWELQQIVDSNGVLIQALMHGAEGIRVIQPTSLLPILEGVHLEMISLHIESSFESSLVEDLKTCGADASLKGSWLLPVSTEGYDPRVQMNHMKQVKSEFPLLRSWSCPSVRWLNDGGNAAQVIARIGRALDGLTSAFQTNGEKVNALKHVELEWSIHENVLFEIACLRAVRFFWSRWCELHDFPEIEVWINAVNAPYAKNPVKDEDHLIPLTAGVYAAVIGGADGVMAVPHDAAQFGGIGSNEGLRWARNVHHIMREESGLHKVADPMGGSDVIESWTHSILDLAWKHYKSPSTGEVENNF